MSADQFISLQHQIRQNQEDVSDFIRDLKSWESNIKQKDAKLRKKSDSDSNSEDEQPPIRNRVREKKMRKKVQHMNIEVVEADDVKKEEKVEKKPERIKAYDYRAWDKFDVNKACEDVDGEGYSAGSEYETDSDAEREELERQRKIQEANEEKERGNSLFKKGRYEDAVTCYTKGIDADPTNAILPANRAMALLKLKRYSEAEKDCSVSIRLDFTYVKAYARRGTARIELRNFEDAKKDFMQVLNIEPSNKQAASEIRKIDSKLKQLEKERMEEAEKKRMKLAEEEGIVRPIHKPPHLRSKKPLRRIAIEEIGQTEKNSDDEDNDSKMNQSASPSFERVSHPEIDADEIILKSKDRRRLEDTEDASSKSPAPSSSAASSDPVCWSTKVNIPLTPQTSYQLAKDWKQLQKYPPYLYQYFKQISPSSYPKILQQSLDSNLLIGILRLIVDFYIPSNDPVFEMLQCLSSVQRFDMNVMFMSKQDKKMVEAIFAHLRNTGEATGGEIEKLAAKYGL